MRLLVLAAFVGGVCLLQLQATLPSPAALVFLGTLSLALAAGAVRVATARSGPPTAAVVAAAGALAAGFSYAGLQSTLRLADALPFEDEGRDIVVEGIVATLPGRVERGIRFEFDVERVLTPDARVPSRLMLGWYNDVPRVRPAERWRFTVRLKRPHGVQNPGGFDLEAWMLERNLRASGAVRNGRRDASPELIAPLAASPGAWIERGRYALRERLAPSLDGRRYGGVLLALVIGDQRAIGAPDWTLFNRTGISHLVSISGLHITMIAGLVGACIAAAWRRTPALVGRAPAQAAAVFAGLGAAIGYSLLAGWGIPAQRTVLMLTVVAFAWLARVRVGLGTSLALAAALVCLVDPWAVLAAGFWLSFGAVAGIVWVVHGRIEDPRVPTWRRALLAATRVQLAVTLALMPATVMLFHQLSLVSPVANALAIPVVSWIVTPVALVAAVFAALPGGGALADLLLGASHGVFALLAQWLEWLAALPSATRAVATPPPFVIGLVLVGIGWLLAPPGWPLRALGAALIVPLFLWPPERPRHGELWVTALDIGQGSAVLVESRDGAWLFDAGPRYANDSDAGERVVLPYLRHRGIARLEGLVVSHLDSDHSGGTAALLRGMPVQRVLSSIPSAHPMFLGRAVDRCLAGERWEQGTLRFTMLHPVPDDYSRRRTTNAMSCTVLVTLGPHRVLLTGDIGVVEEAAILARLPSLRVDWMAAPHHGSRSSSSAALLGSVGAREAVAQAGYRNRYGHPDAAVAARYAEHGIALHRTDHAGALQWRFLPDGTIRRSAWRTEGVRYWHNQPGRPAIAEADDAEETADPVPMEPLIAG